MRLALKFAICVLLAGLIACKKNIFRVIPAVKDPKTAFYPDLEFHATMTDSIKILSMPIFSPPNSIDSIDQVILYYSVCGDEDWGCAFAKIKVQKNATHENSYYQIENNKVVVYVKIIEPYWIAGPGRIEILYK